MTTVQDRRTAALQTPSTFSENAVKDLAASLTALLADCFALYLKTKNFHWHMSGPHFRDHHLMLDEQADQIFAMTDPIAGPGSCSKAPAHTDSRETRRLDRCIATVETTGPYWGDRRARSTHSIMRLASNGLERKATAPCCSAC